MAPPPRSKVYEVLASGDLPSIRVGWSIRVPVTARHAWIERQLASRAEEIQCAAPLVTGCLS